jgi:hypothetical protein
MTSTSIRSALPVILCVAYRAKPATSVAIKITLFRTEGGEDGRIILGERRTPGQRDETLTIPFDTEAEAREWFEQQTAEGDWSTHAPEGSENFGRKTIE